MIVAVLDFLGVPHEGGFFNKDLNAKSYLTEGWAERVFEKFRAVYSEPVLLFYINHLSWELTDRAEPFRRLPRREDAGENFSVARVHGKLYNHESVGSLYEWVPSIAVASRNSWGEAPKNGETATPCGTAISVPRAGRPEACGPVKVARLEGGLNDARCGPA
jgi:hypothetical protein